HRPGSGCRHPGRRARVLRRPARDLGRAERGRHLGDDRGSIRPGRDTVRDHRAVELRDLRRRCGGERLQLRRDYAAPGGRGWARRLARRDERDRGLRVHRVPGGRAGVRQLHGLRRRGGCAVRGDRPDPRAEGGPARADRGHLRGPARGGHRGSVRAGRPHPAGAPVLLGDQQHVDRQRLGWSGRGPGSAGAGGHQLRRARRAVSSRVRGGAAPVRDRTARLGGGTEPVDDSPAPVRGGAAPVLAGVASALVWGTGQALNRQLGKALMFLAVFAGAITAEMLSGNYYPGMDFSPRTHGGFFVKGLWGLITLGSEPRRMTINGLTEGDNSIVLMANGLIAALTLALLAVVWVWGIRDAVGYARGLRQGRAPETSAAYFRRLWSDAFAYIALSPGLVLVVFMSALPVLFGVLVAFTNYNRDNLPPTSLVRWVGLDNFVALASVPAWAQTFLGVLG